MAVVPGSAIDGKTIEAAGLRHLQGAFVAALERNGLRRVPVPPDEVLRGNDQLTFVGGVDTVVEVNRMRGLIPATNQAAKLSYPPHARIMAEAVVSPSNPLVGRSVREGRFRNHYEAVIVAVHRNGARVDQKIGDIVLQPGDTLLLETSRRFIHQQRHSRDFFLVSDVPDSRPLRYDRAWIALIIIAAMVCAVAAEEFTGLRTFHAALVAAVLMGLTRCLSVDQARQSVDWSTLVTIAAALVLGRVVESTGLAAAAGGGIMTALRPFGPIAVLAGIYLVTLVATELVTNNAAAALTFPLAHAVAAEMGVNFMPFAVVIAIAASCGFATPLGYQTHLMVYGVGGYRFTDYVRMGVPLDLAAMVITVALTPLVFPFY
jgi:di/tricarboxylate transporter